MYYFTSPLIVFSFFNFSQRGQTIIGLLLYLSSYLIAEISHSMGMRPWIEISAEMLNFLYITNVFFAFSFLIVLARSFSKFHYFTSQKVIFKNQELEHNKNELETLLNEKNTLLSETHHRVKNNLAVISGLFDLQLMFEKDPKLKSIFTNSKNRIKSMSLIHESLYRQTNVSQIDFKIYTELLISEIKNSMEIDKNVQIKIDMESIYFNLSKAIPCGLIINEVVTNCFKHAFIETEMPHLIIQLTHNARYCLTIIDNGKGIPINSDANQNSLGMILIDAFAKQLDGEISFKNNNGTTFSLTFDEP
jgi:two-component sensor histidine kinase